MLFFIELINTSDEVQSREKPLLSKRHHLQRLKALMLLERLK